MMMIVLIFADLMNYRIIIVENTQAQYFDNLTRHCVRVLSTMTIHSCIKLPICFLLHTLRQSWLLSEKGNSKQAQLTVCMGRFCNNMLSFSLLYMTYIILLVVIIHEFIFFRFLSVHNVKTILYFLLFSYHPTIYHTTFILAHLIFV